MRSLLYAGVGLILAHSLSAQERVRLDFAWPAGMSGTVTETTQMSQSVMGMANDQRTVTRRGIETLDHPEGLRIRYLRGELLETSAPGMEAIEGGDEVTRLMAEAPYDMIVDDQGSIVEITRDQETLDSLRAGMERMLEPLQGMPNAESMTSMLEGMIGGEALDAAISQNWNSSVGLWNADELTLGETYTSEEEAPFPLVQNRTILMEMSTTVVERTPCYEGGAPDGCVKVVMVSVIDPDDFRPLMQEMMGEMMAGLPEEMPMEFGNIDVNTTTEAIVEPGTLVPHRITMTSGGDIEMILMGQAMTTTQEMVATMTYDWQRR
jgi:hypothetical protein